MPTISPIIQNGRCVICKRKTIHKDMRNTTPIGIKKHRDTERRNCLGYEDCLMQTAIEDWICVPCCICERFESKIGS